MREPRRPKLPGSEVVEVTFEVVVVVADAVAVEVVVVSVATTAQREVSHRGTTRDVSIYRDYIA